MRFDHCREIGPNRLRVPQGFSKIERPSDFRGSSTIGLHRSLCDCGVGDSDRVVEDLIQKVNPFLAIVGQII